MPFFFSLLLWLIISLAFSSRLTPLVLLSGAHSSSSSPPTSTLLVLMSNSWLALTFWSAPYSRRVLQLLMRIPTTPPSHRPRLYVDVFEDISRKDYGIVSTWEELLLVVADTKTSLLPLILFAYVSFFKMFIFWKSPPFVLWNSKMCEEEVSYPRRFLRSPPLPLAITTLDCWLLWASLATPKGHFVSHFLSLSLFVPSWFFDAKQIWMMVRA